MSREQELADCLLRILRCSRMPKNRVRGSMPPTPSYVINVPGDLLECAQGLVGDPMPLDANPKPKAKAERRPRKPRMVRWPD